MDKAAPKTIYLNEYQQPDFKFVNTHLDIRLGFTHTQITATHRVEKRATQTRSLDLNCELIDLHSVCINGVELEENEYELVDSILTIKDTPEQFDLVIKNSIDPSQNTALSGLYQSGDMLCTQCEAEGYRRITPALDRPDSLSTYEVRLTADKTDFPVLLCNGNLLDEADNNDGTHSTTWHDPFPKPTYLFAIVAGKLSCMEDSFTTKNGRHVQLKFYARGEDISKCAHAMVSLKKSMVWDEEVYGREYDLDLFNVVAVGDFNMGAMENKSLNVFNTKYVLADPTMATDNDFYNVESVIGHEYFHNWSGNRVTCRDWFQLSLKEGFTVFRDQEFSADMGSRGVKRICDVNVLRSHQFKEDASPMSHPIRPESYQEINNFYTVTIYNKGAEVVRMIHTLLGEKLFRKGSDLYFSRHDGEAVTTDHFVRAMEDATNTDLTQFKNWYSQSGTPELKISCEFQQQNEKYNVTIRQSCPDTPGQSNKQPFVIPVSFSLFDRDGKKLLLDESNYEKVLVVDEVSKSFEFNNIKRQPVPSLLRNFSAPVKITTTLSNEDLITLLAYDDDPFNRWEAGQTLYLNQIQENIKNLSSNQPILTDESLSKVFTQIFSTYSGDQSYQAQLISLPTAAYISEFLDPIDPQLIHSGRNALQVSLSEANEEILTETINQCESINTGAVTSDEMNARDLRDACLNYLSALDTPNYRSLCTSLLKNAKCMTDESSAITLIARSNRKDKSDLLNEFYKKWKDEPLVIDKWLRAQSSANNAKTLNIVENLTNHPGFDKTNPNKVYALILGFTHANPVCFHAEDGSGYQFLLKWVKELDPINPQVASRLVSALNGWQKYTPILRNQMKETLQRVADIPTLSADVKEIVMKNLT